MHRHTKYRKDRSQTVGRYRDFCDFPDGGCRHLEFSKIRNFNGISAVGGQYASACQISSKSVKRLQRYGDLTVLKMAAVRHLGFVKFEIFNAAAVKRPILHQRTKFRKDRSNHYGDTAIFVIFQGGGRPPFCKPLNRHISATV